MDTKGWATLFGGPIGTLILASLFAWFGEAVWDVMWLTTFLFSIGGFWLLLVLLSRVPGSYRWMPFGAVEAVSLVKVARAESDDMSGVVPLLEARLDEPSLQKTNPRLVIYFHGFNGAAFPIRLASTTAEGHIATQGNVLPGVVEISLRNSKEIRRGQAFVLELALALNSESVKLLTDWGTQHNYVELHFRGVNVFVTSVGGLNDSVQHRLVLRDSIQFHVAQNRRKGATSLWDDKFA